MINKNTIFLDCAATMPLLPSVKERMMEAMDLYGNPSSLYQLGQDAAHEIKQARELIADYINCDPECIIFNSGGSEGNSQAIISFYEYAVKNGLGNHIITSQIEHHSVLNACKYLEEYRGAEVTYLGVDSNGIVRTDDIERFVTNDTCLISIMGVNNEIGTIQDMYFIGEIARYYNALYHSDCVQEFGHVNFDATNVDMFSMSAHKLGGPKGVGFLYLTKYTPLLPLIHGTQNNSLRGGTYNTLGIIGLAEAVKQSMDNMYEWNRQILKLTSHMKKRIMAEIPKVKLNGSERQRTVNNLNFSFDGIRGEELMIMLDMRGICVSTGSACNSDSGEPSYVLKAIGLSDDEANSSIRITLSQNNTLEEIDYAVDRIKETVEFLRRR